MRQYAFQELAYAIVVSTAYGGIMGAFIFGNFSDIYIYILWGLLIVAHLAGIWFLEYLEEQKRKNREESSTKKNSE
ncbi:MAG: hypothetical protein ACXAC8_15790 [Candidatus Hodarchaeales archaeon]|jgi:hypothetical protein